jgi:hypothetical protein
MRSIAPAALQPVTPGPQEADGSRDSTRPRRGWRRWWFPLIESNAVSRQASLWAHSSHPIDRWRYELPTSGFLRSVKYHGH